MDTKDIRPKEEAKGNHYEQGQTGNLDAADKKSRFFGNCRTFSYQSGDSEDHPQPGCDRGTGDCSVTVWMDISF